MAKNHVPLVLTPEESQKIADAIKEISDILQSKLNKLSDEEQKKLQKIGPQKSGFLSTSIAQAEQNPSMLPGYFDLEAVKAEYKAYTTMKQICDPLRTIVDLLEDTMALSESEAYLQLLSFYDYVKAAVKNRQPGAQLIYDELKPWFAHASSSKDDSSKSDEKTEEQSAK